jgi:hypothetical protein
MGNNLTIGATVDVGAINQGMANVQEITKTAANGIAISFQEASAKTKAAVRGLSDDVKQAAQSVSAESLRVAEATKAQVAAMADLRRAMTIARDANVDAAQSSSLLAAVQQKVAAAAAEMAAAKKAEAAAVAEAAEEEALSQNVIVRAFQKAALEVTELTEVIRERAIEAAEEGGLAEGGLRGGFAALGALSGIGIAGGFAAHFLDETAKVVVELEHLHTQTGLSVQSLAGLQQMVKEMGGEFEPISTGLIRLNRAFVEATDGTRSYQQAFADVGLRWEQLKDQSPEERLNAVAGAFARTSDVGKSAAAAITLFGKGGVALIPVLKEQGDQLEANMKRAGELTGITDQTAAAARRWTQDTARLGAEFRSVLMPVIEHADPVIRSVAVAFEVAAASIISVAEAAATAVVALGSGLKSVGTLVLDAVRGDWAGLVTDAKAAKDQFVDVWKAGLNEVRANFKIVADDAGKIHWNAGGGGPEEAPGGNGSFTIPKTKVTAVQREEAELNAIKVEAGQRGLAIGVDYEIRFWQAKLAAAQKGSADYREILGKLAPLEAEAAKKKAIKIPTEGEDNITEAVEAFKAANDQEVRDAEDAARRIVAAYRSGRDEEIRIAQEKYKDREQDSAFEVRMGQLTAQQRIALLKDAANQEYQVEMQAVRAKELADLQDTDRYQADLNREVELTREHDRQIVQLNQQASQQSQQGWEKLWNGMTQQMNRVLLLMLEGHKNLARQLAQVWNGVVQTFAQNVLKMAEQYLIGLALQKSGQKSQIMADAKTAAANTYTAVSAIPVVGPFLAPPAAAGAFAAVMAFESFNEGGVVTAGNGMHVPILAKAGERVLTPTQTQNFDSLVNTSALTTRASSTVNMGGVEQHFHGAQATPRQMQRGINDAVRRGRLRMA